MKYNIAVVSGDGVGPEVTKEAIKVLDRIAKKFNHTFIFTEVPAGGLAIDLTGKPLPEETLKTCQSSDAVLLGAVGGPKWDNEPAENRPERALLGLRKALGLYANLRPAVVFPQLAESSPLKKEIVSSGLDILIVRELTGGIYFGKHETIADGKSRSAYDVESYTDEEIKRIAVTAFDMALKRNKSVTSIDKANVLDSSRLWRSVVEEVSTSYPEVKLSHMYVDNAAMQLIKNPAQFDVLLTNNIFGDILSDEASQITGSIGMLPSASLAKGNFGMYEPVHGSAPDIAGTGKANPIAAILSASMMLKYTFGLNEESSEIEKAVSSFLDTGLRTLDIAGPYEKTVSTAEAGDKIASFI